MEGLTRATFDRARAGDLTAMVQLEKQIVSERKSLAAELEEKKEKVRKG